MNLVDINRERRNVFDDLTQLVRQFDFFPFLGRIKIAVVAFVFIQFVEDNLFGVGHHHESPKVEEWLVVIDFLGIGIFHQITFRGCLLLIQYFELDLAVYLRGCGLWQNPGGVEILYVTNAGYDARLQSAGCQHHKIVGKGWIVRLQHREV